MPHIIISDNSDENSDHSYHIMDIRQSPHYAAYMRSLGWKVEKIDKWNAFIKPFPLIGSFIKIQRIGNPVPWEEIKQLSIKHRAFRIIIEPYEPILQTLKPSNLQTVSAPFSPTRTIHIDLTPNEEIIFRRFKESTRRAVRRAEKLGITVKESNDIELFARMKTKNLFPVAFFMRNDIKKLWLSFQPNNATILFAYNQIPNGNKRTANSEQRITNPLAGILLLFYGKTAYYWHAFSTLEGNKLRAPSLLVWEALKVSKKRGCKIFDFEGIYDERFPKQFKNWKGFTRFKKGFGGKKVIYPSSYSLVNLPFL